jgi:Rhs element Vgr protein
LTNPPLSPPRGARGSTPQEVSMETYAWKFSTSNIDTNVFRVLAFTGEDSVCQGYRFDILLLVKNLDAASAPAFLDKMAEATTHTFTGSIMQEDTETKSFTWRGMPERVEWLFPATGGGCVMRAQLRPHSFKLRLGVHSRVFLESNVPTLLDNLLKTEGFNSGDDFTSIANQERAESTDEDKKYKYMTRPMSCQYNESSFNFLLRHLERVGGYSYIEQVEATPATPTTPAKPATDRLVLADDATDVPDLPEGAALDWDEKRQNSFVVYSFARSRASCPNAVTLRDYSTEKPGKASYPSEITSGTVSGIAVNYFGQFNMFGETALDTAYSADDVKAQADLMADARLRSLKCRSNLIRGESTVAWMRAGYRFILEKKQYQILTTSCSCTCFGTDYVNESTNVSRAAGFGFTIDVNQGGYRNSFTCHDRDLGPFAPEITARRPVVSGLTHAVIHSSWGTGGYADLDAKGRYLVKLPFPEGVYGGNGISIPIRMAQINASSRDTVHAGVHLPLLAKTEVLVAFTDGDPDRPVIIAALPNTDNPSVVNQDNSKTNVIRTPGGHTLTLDDTDERTSITLASKAGHMLTLDDTTGAPKIVVTSKAGHKLTLDDKTRAPKIVVTSKAGHTLTLDDTETAPKISIKSHGGHTLTLDDTKGASNMTLHSSSGHFLKLDDEKKTVTLQSSDPQMSIVFDVEKGSLKMKNGDQSTTIFRELGKYLEQGTHKETALGGNSFSFVGGASEAFNMGLKLAVSAGVNITTNLVANEVLNLGFNAVQNIGATSTINIGPAGVLNLLGANKVSLSENDIAASDMKLYTQLTRMGLINTII